MGTMVQKFIVEDVEKASSLMPAHIALVNPDGTPWTGGGGSAEITDGSITTTKIADDAVTADKIADGVIPTVPGAATTSAQGLVKKASATNAVASADATAAAGDAPTKAEFDAVVTLCNELKAQVNDLITKAKSAGQMA